MKKSKLFITLFIMFHWTYFQNLPYNFFNIRPDLDQESDNEKQERLEREQKLYKEIKQIVEARKKQEINRLFYICILLTFLWILYGCFPDSFKLDLSYLENWI